MARASRSLTPSPGWPLRLALLGLGVVASGCSLVRVELAAPVADFAASVTAAGEVVASYYTSLNAYERDLQLRALAASGERVALVETMADGTPRFAAWWTGPFAPAAIAARLRLLALLGGYADGLLALSGDDEDARRRRQFAEVGKDLDALATRWTALHAGGLDAQARAYLGPLATLAGEVATLAAARNRAAMLASALARSQDAVRALLAALEQDFDAVVLAGHRLGELQRLADAVRAYNDQEPARQERLRAARAQLAAIPDPGTPDQQALRVQLQGVIASESAAVAHGRLAQLQELVVIYERYQAFVDGAPTRLFPAIERSFAALVTVLEKDRSPKDWRELADRLARLRAETAQLVAAARAVHAAGRER